MRKRCDLFFWCCSLHCDLTCGAVNDQLSMICSVYLFNMWSAFFQEFLLIPAGCNNHWSNDHLCSSSAANRTAARSTLRRRTRTGQRVCHAGQSYSIRHCKENEAPFKRTMNYGRTNSSGGAFSCWGIRNLREYFPIFSLFCVPFARMCGTADEFSSYGSALSHCTYGCITSI